MLTHHRPSPHRLTRELNPASPGPSMFSHANKYTVTCTPTYILSPLQCPLTEDFWPRRPHNLLHLLRLPLPDQDLQGARAEEDHRLRERGGAQSDGQVRRGVEIVDLKWESSCGWREASALWSHRDVYGFGSDLRGLGARGGLLPLFARR